jgi:hypothetical protein
MTAILRLFFKSLFVVISPSFHNKSKAEERRGLDQSGFCDNDLRKTVSGELVLC